MGKNNPDNYATTDSFVVIRNTTVFLGLGNALIATLQIVVAYLSASHALFADAMHTYADLIIDILTYFAGFYGHQPPDGDHPYGHRRIETVTAVFLALFLASLGAGIIIDTLLLDKGGELVITEYVLIASGISVVLNEILYRYASTQARRIRSELLAASATHQRSDALSSVLVFATAAISYLPVQGWNVDKVAAVIIGVMIMKMSIKIAYKGIKELIDTGISEEERQAMIATMQQVAGVEDIHLLRNRKMAGSVYVDVHVITKPTISVSEGHFIGENVHHAVKQAHPHVVDVTVHIDPEDDEWYHNQPPEEWPSREIIEQSLAKTASKHKLTLGDITIHYLRAGITIEVVSPDTNKKATQLWAEQALSDVRQHSSLVTEVLVRSNTATAS